MLTTEALHCCKQYNYQLYDQNMSINKQNFCHSDQQPLERNINDENNIIDRPA